MEAGAAGTIWNTISLFAVPVLLIAAMYFIAIRPQQKREKQARNMLKALKPGDRVVTIGGLYGTIRNLDEERVTLMVGAKGKEDEKTLLVFRRDAIRSVEGVSSENEGDL